MRRFIKNIEWSELCVMAAVLIAAFAFVDMICGSKKEFHAVIVDKVFIPEHDYTTTEMEYRGSGKSGSWVPVVHYHHDPAKRQFMVQRKNGSIITLSTEAAMYYRKPIGSVVAYKTHFGYLTGWAYWSYAISKNTEIIY